MKIQFIDPSPEKFRTRYEPFVGEYAEFGNYRLYWRHDFWRVEHAGEWLGNKKYFIEAVELCREHARPL